MLDARTIHVSIDRDWRQVYDAFWAPESFPIWASGLSDASLRQDGGVWTAQGPAGPIQIKFSDHNPFGIMDHWVDLGGGRIVYVPMRIVENGAGATVFFTLFRQPGMSDEKFAEDEAWVRRDLDRFKACAEDPASRSSCG